MIATAIKAAIRPYSIAVAPLSSLLKRLKNCTIENLSFRVGGEFRPDDVAGVLRADKILAMSF
jgi:hypothetical protein